MSKHLLCIFLIASAFALPAQNPWSDISEKNIPAQPSAQRYIAPRKYRVLRLERGALQPLLAKAPERFKTSAAEQEITLTLPMPDGAWARFRLAESPVMAPELQAQFPDIRCYTGAGIDDPSATLKCDLTPQGFHAMIRPAQGDAVFIDPYRRGDNDHYIVYKKSDYRSKKEPLLCGFEDTPDYDALTKNNLPELQGDCMFRRYRLALACTGEYAQFQGGTTTLALAAMATTLHRVNGIYERDFAITLQLIATNNLLVFLNAATDGYTNGNASSMLTENQNKCNTVIGSLNYDVGHVFGTSGGGLSGQGVVCGNSVKAWGVTAVSQPVGDPFDVDYVAHELGHQFGASHSFNNSCNDNINLGTAVEPGSGSTIMSYAGICSPNVQTHCDAYFHGVNLQEINAYVTTSQGNICPLKINVGNHNPTVDAGPNYTIPKSTPFALTATGSDADGDPLTYCWEQMDNQQAAMPPVATNTAGPMFRSFAPDTAPTRYFPRLPDQAANNNPIWEKLPAVARPLNFRVTVRDNHIGGGCTAEDNLILTVAATAGPFLVTEPNTALTWFIGDTRTVKWNVAATDAAPVSCAQVRILLSTDGGLTYPVLLADNLPNTGSASVEVPNNPSVNCRVMVRAVGNVFFDVSDQDFKIEFPPAPTFLLSTSTNDKEQVCSGTALAFHADITGISGFSDTVQVGLDGAPAGATVQVDPAAVLPGNSATIQLTGLNTPGVYTLTVHGSSGALTRTRTIELTVVNGTPDAAVLGSPADGALNVIPLTTLSWTPVVSALSYLVQVATSPSFAPGAVVLEKTVAAPTAGLSGLNAGTVYYWRVKTANACAESAFSSVFAFQTGQADCGYAVNSTNVPVIISSLEAGIVTSTLNVPAGRYIADVNATLQINHTWVGDLSARLIAPSGESAALFDQPGYPLLDSGCNGDNLNISLDDEAAQSAAQLENTCNNLPAISGSFQPIDALNRFDNTSAQGTWTLEVTDNLAEDGGALNAWSLSFCFYDTVPAAELLVNNPLTVVSGKSGTLTLSHLVMNIFSGNASEGAFVLLSLPAHGNLSRSGVPLAVGGVFTQQDILNGTVAYTHNGDTAPSDVFLFDVLDASTGSWVHNSAFQILIIQNDLAVSAEVTQNLLCAGDQNGQIAVTVTGGTPPFTYQLNNGAPQSSNIFDNLMAGAYTVVVTDQNGFSAGSSIAVTSPPAIEVSLEIVTDDLSAMATGGTPPLQYSLDGSVFQSGNFFENLANGAYTVTVRDANGCTAAAEGAIDIEQLVAQTVVTTPVACHNDANGIITVSAAGGVIPYAYSLNGIDFQTGNVFNHLNAGMYTVVVKDDSGNTVSSNTVTLTNPPPITIPGAAVNLNTITVTATGGTGTLTYSLNGISFQTSTLFADLPNGTYTITVRDVRGCTATTTATVEVPALVITAVHTGGEIACAGATLSLVVSAAGGVPPYEYRLDGGAYQPDSTFKNVGAGAHTIAVRDAALTIVNAPAIYITEPDPLSAGASVSGNDVTIEAVGGTPPYTYSLNSGPAQSPNTFANLSNGMYEAVIKDANGCTATVAFTVEYTPLSVNASAVDPLCAGDANGSIALGISGGTAPYYCSVNGDTLCTLANLPAATYTIVVSDALGDSVQITVILYDPPALSAGVAVSADSIIVSASGGSGALQYSLDGVNFQSDPVFANVPNGIYTVRVRDISGCLAAVENVVVDYTGTVEPLRAWGLSVQPNPSAGRFHLTMRRAPAGTIRADVFDTGGRRVFERRYEPAGSLLSETLNLDQLPAGLYLLRLTSGVQVGTVRLLLH